MEMKEAMDEIMDFSRKRPDSDGTESFAHRRNGGIRLRRVRSSVFKQQTFDTEH